MQSGTVPLEDSWGVSYKATYSPNVPSSNCAPCYLSKHVENLCQHKNLHIKVDSFIDSCQHIEATNVFQ